MVLTNDTRLQIRRHITDLLKGRNITDKDQVRMIITALCDELERLEAKTITIDESTFVGTYIPVALMHSSDYAPVVYNNKKYLGFSNDTICIFASRNYAKLIKESVAIMEPNGWGDEEDIMMSSPVYSIATCGDVDHIYDLTFMYH